MIRKAIFGLAVLLGKKVFAKVARKAADRAAERIFKPRPPR
ncbi:MAG: hypothetical protein AB1710_04740 [Pseudomonadota bacterium]|jgi:hypothetical protein